MDEQRLQAMVEAATLGILATRRADGRPQQSPVSYAFDPARALLRFTTTADRAKAVNLARDPRASMLVMGPTPWSYAVAQVRVPVLLHVERYYGAPPAQ